MSYYKPWPPRQVRQNHCMNTIPCAVIVPIVKIDGQEQLVFEVRNSQLRWQPGDICFPGGKIEPDDSSTLEAAVREMIEELGIEREQIHILGPLDYIESPVGVTVWPFAAYIDTTHFTISHGEIDHVFTVPVEWFRTHAPQVHQIEIATRPAPGFPEGLSISGQTQWKRRKNYNVLLYEYQAYKIWGITAHILDNFMNIRL